MRRTQRQTDFSRLQPIVFHNFVRPWRRNRGCISFRGAAFPASLATECKSHATRNLRRIRGNFDATPLKISATRSEFQQLRTSENEPTNYVIAP
jgi:hypothetical protein